MRTALGYVRVSTDEQADRGLGLEAQRQRVRAYCEMKGLHLAEVDAGALVEAAQNAGHPGLADHAAGGENEDIRAQNGHRQPL